MPNVSFSSGFLFFGASRIPDIFFRAISSCISTFIEYFRQFFHSIQMKIRWNDEQEFHSNCFHFAAERSQWANEAERMNFGHQGLRNSFFNFMKHPTLFDPSIEWLPDTDVYLAARLRGRITGISFQFNFHLEVIKRWNCTFAAFFSPIWLSWTSGESCPPLAARVSSSLGAIFISRKKQQQWNAN